MFSQFTGRAVRDAVKRDGLIDVYVYPWRLPQAPRGSWHLVALVVAPGRDKMLECYPRFPMYPGNTFNLVGHSRTAITRARPFPLAYLLFINGWFALATEA